MVAFGVLVLLANCTKKPESVTNVVSPRLGLGKNFSLILPFPSGDRVKVTVIIPQIWQIDGNIAGPVIQATGDIDKRIEFSGYFATATASVNAFRKDLAKNERILRQNKISKMYTLYVTSNSAAYGETGDQSVRGKITNVYIVDSQDRYQSVMFYEVATTAEERGLTALMIEKMTIEILSD